MRFWKKNCYQSTEDIEVQFRLKRTDKGHHAKLHGMALNDTGDLLFSAAQVCVCETIYTAMTPDLSVPGPTVRGQRASPSTEPQLSVRRARPSRHLTHSRRAPKNVFVLIRSPLNVRGIAFQWTRGRESPMSSTEILTDSNTILRRVTSAART